ncbi:protein kinase [Frankia sp. CH37]|nr:protein kinase [Parafrankia sp. CH37]
MAPEQACSVGLAVAAALGHAHSRGVLHRDIKADNILFASDGTPKVGDFGIANCSKDPPRRQWADRDTDVHGAGADRGRPAGAGDGSVRPWHRPLPAAHRSTAVRPEAAAARALAPAVERPATADDRRGRLGGTGGAASAGEGSQGPPP